MNWLRSRVNEFWILVTVVIVTIIIAAWGTTPEANAAAKMPRCKGRPFPVKICREIRRQAHRRHVPARWAVDPNFAKLIWHESSFRLHAVNSDSGACGLGQMLPCNKYGDGCYPKLRDQVKCMIRYVRDRYHSPRRAWQFWLRQQPNHWY